jgi:hypothetical protein
MLPARGAAPVFVVALAVLALLAAPAAALAADPVAVSGTVVHDGAPAIGVQVVVSVTGGDEVAAATTDEQGAFSVDVEADAGAQVRIDVTGQTSRSDPDARNCVHIETPSGSLTFSIEALPPAAVEVAMDDVLTGTECGPTPSVRITPPSTDATSRRVGSSSGTGLLLVLGALSLVAGATLALSARRWR